MKKQKVIFVYGNHGKSAPQIEDYHNYLEPIFRKLDFLCIYAEDPVPGQLNVFLECFNPRDIEKIEAAKAHPDSRFICIATEFITGNTFNNFGAKKGVVAEYGNKSVYEVSRFVFPNFLRALLIKYFAGPYFSLRKHFYSVFGKPQLSNYDMGAYFKFRYKMFHQGVGLFDEIWCVSPSQMDTYVKAYGDKVKLMPVCSWEPFREIAAKDEYEKDFDVLFTGSWTHYREAVTENLVNQGIRVMVGPSTLPAYMRDHYLNRSKFAIQIRQNGDWRYPSIMRYHFLLNSGIYVIGEQTGDACVQEKYCSVVPPALFADEVIRLVRNGNCEELGRKAALAYFEGSAGDREILTNLIMKFKRAPELEAARDSAFVPHANA